MTNEFTPRHITPETCLINDASVEKLMYDLFYGSEAGWAAMEFNCVEAGLIEMIQGFQAGRMRGTTAMVGTIIGATTAGP